MFFRTLSLIRFLALGFVVLATGCIMEADHTYDGPPRVEFAPTSQTVQQGAGTVDINVQLIAPHQGEALNVPYTVDEEATTAQQGVHYERVSSSPIAIPADSSFGDLTVNVLDGNIDGDSVKLVLVLQGNEDQEVFPAENYKTFTLTITD